MHVLRKLKTFKAALFAGLAALVLTTCTAAVSGLPLASEAGRSEADGGLDVATTKAPPGLTPKDTNASPAPQPVTPATGVPIVPVDPAPNQTEPVEPAPLASNAAPIQFDKVTVQQPRLRVTGITRKGTLDAIRKVKGVRYATAFSVGRIPVGPRGTPVTVAAVDPKSFRVLTPQVTADAVAVWQRIAEGDAAFTHDAGTRLKAQLGSMVPIGAEGYTLRVGAYASNGIPPVADALISPQKAQSLGIQGRRDVLVSLQEGTDPAELARAVRQAARANVDIIEEPQARRAYLTGDDARTAFEPFNYIDMGDGMIQIDPGWVSRNIVRRSMPLLKGEVVCHRLMVNQLYGALKEIQDRGLGRFIDPSQYGGCWVPRHIDFDPSDPLSMHAWGLAADFNVSTNGLGMKPKMDPRIVAVFDRWGFVWGGRWSRPDGMHFELGALVQNSPQG